MDREAWHAAAHGVAKSQTWLRDWTELNWLMYAWSVAKLCPTLCNPMDCSPPGCLSMGFSRQEYWSGLPFPPPGDLPNPGIKPCLLSLLRFLHWQAGSSPLNHLGSPQIWLYPQEIILFTLFTSLNQGFSPPAQLVCSLSRWFTKQPPS